MAAFKVGDPYNHPNFWIVNSKLLEIIDLILSSHFINEKSEAQRGKTFVAQFISGTPAAEYL